MTAKTTYRTRFAFAGSTGWELVKVNTHTNLLAAKSAATLLVLMHPKMWSRVARIEIAEDHSTPGLSLDYAWHVVSNATRKVPPERLTNWSWSDE